MKSLTDELRKIVDRPDMVLSSTRVYKVLEEVEFLRSRGMLVRSGLGRLQDIIHMYDQPMVMIDGKRVFKGDILYSCPFHSNRLRTEPFTCQQINSITDQRHVCGLASVSLIADGGFPERDSDY